MQAEKETKKERAKSFRAWLNTVPDNDLIVYSDGSKNLTGTVGWGYVIHRDRRKIAEGEGRLGLAEVIDGEAEGTRRGLYHACCIDQSARIHACIDSTSLIQQLLNEVSAKSQHVFPELRRKFPKSQIEFHWVPAHKGIEGNLQADRLARAGADPREAKKTPLKPARVKSVHRPKIKPGSPANYKKPASPVEQLRPRATYSLASQPEGTRPEANKINQRTQDASNLFSKIEDIQMNGVTLMEVR